MTKARQAVQARVPYGTLTAMQFAAKLLREFPELDELVIADLGDHIYLNKIQVRPAHRGRGIGSNVVRRVQEYARERKLPLVLKHKAGLGHLKNFYGKLGFHGAANKFRYHGGNATMQSESLERLKVGDLLTRALKNPVSASGKWSDVEYPADVLLRVEQLCFDGNRVKVATLSGSRMYWSIPYGSYTGGFLLKATKEDVRRLTKNKLSGKGERLQ